MIVGVTEPKVSWDEVVRVYRSLRSVRRTATAVGLSKSGVEYILRKSNIARFPRNRTGQENSARKAIVPGTPSALVRDVNVMRELYVVERKSIPEIAQQLGVSQRTVLTGMKQCGISRRSKSEALRGKTRPNSQGPRHRDWKGGVTHWRKRARKRLNAAFVRPVMERDNFRCVWCESKRELVVHHHVRKFAAIVAQVRRPDMSDEEIIEAIVAVHRLSDEITLCKTCHDDHHRRNGK